ncbi:NAD(P)H-hydrate dehydratase [Hyphomicrobium sp.]|uniref:NAD(P)H-hydrate dehydratase n=1 Tax=Hyphomicrobium sp. TaxID=82 RepID=UPI002E2FE17B|nr:NAD(P)H-hydrate dehydratase [Hyphomicrobium sp.]HEX2843522.1 NAD(P)H-hydrate dehydratase [Hyphomicrobium sp.]
MGRADCLALSHGVASLALMEAAGQAVADAARRLVPPGSRVAVLCGPGNNGGDGIVAARYLKRASYDVRLFLLGDKSALKGDAAEMARRFDGPFRPFDPFQLDSLHLVIDAMFGAGLSRPIDGVAAEVIEAVKERGTPVLAVDVPSGLDGATGNAYGPVLRATETVTFFRLKPGHVLYPGRDLCGTIRIADIGIPPDVLRDIGVTTFLNEPALWRDCLRWPSHSGHKYSRGHAMAVSGPAHATGAARLGARGALRAGAGLVTVASPLDAVTVNAMHLTAVMLKPFEGPEGLSELLADARKNAVLIGPGGGVGEATCRLVEAALRSPASVVIDADALSSFAGNVERLRAAIAARDDRGVVLTPHDGEFDRLFGAVPGSKLERARQGARETGAVVLLKGPDTVVAAPDGRAAINTNAPPWLATAGSGDVLGGVITGLLAQRMPAFEAAAAGAWLHGAAAQDFGPGLIAEDLPERLPAVLARLMPEATDR